MTDTVDTALVVTGRIKFVWRGCAADSLEAPDEGELVEFPAGNAVYGMLWNGEALSMPPAPPPPPAERRLIPKSTIQARLVAAGLFETAFTALLSEPVQFGQWFAPDWPNVYFDDEGMVALLTAIGADVAAITAP